MSRAPQAQLQPVKVRMGWSAPWYSSFGSDFNADFGVGTEAGESFGLSVFLRAGDTISRSYFTSNRVAVYALAKCRVVPTLGWI